MKEYGFNKLGVIFLCSIIMYIGWLLSILYNTFIEIDSLYEDAYNKRLDLNDNVSKIMEIKKVEEYKAEDQKQIEKAEEERLKILELEKINKLKEKLKEIN